MVNEPRPVRGRPVLDQKKISPQFVIQAKVPMDRQTSKATRATIGSVDSRQKTLQPCITLLKTVKQEFTK
jgi:hypothetical protein